VRLVRRYSLVWFGVALWLALWALYAYFEWKVSTFPAHDVPWHLEWARGTTENDQSEMFQNVYLVVATIFAVAIGSAESRDSADRIEAKLDALLGPERVAEIEADLPEKVQR
jgi:hypothetical protein